MPVCWNVPAGCRAGGTSGLCGGSRLQKGEEARANGREREKVLGPAPWSQREPEGVSEDVKEPPGQSREGR